MDSKPNLMFGKINQTVNTTQDKTAESVSILRTKKDHILQQLQTFRFVWWGWLLSSLLGAAFGYIFAVNSSIDKSPDGFRITSRVLAGVFVGNFTYAYFVGVFRFMLSSRLRGIELELVKAGAVELQES